MGIDEEESKAEKKKINNWIEEHKTIIDKKTKSNYLEIEIEELKFYQENQTLQIHYKSKFPRKMFMIFFAIIGLSMLISSIWWSIATLIIAIITTSYYFDEIIILDDKELEIKRITKFRKNIKIKFEEISSINTSLVSHKAKTHGVTVTKKDSVVKGSLC